MKKIFIMGLLCFFLSTNLYATTDSASSTIISVDKVNPQFTIKLESNPSTGFFWVINNYDRNLLILIRHEFIAPKKTGMVGVPGTEVWTFKVRAAAFVAPYKTQIELEYVRSSLENAKNATFTVITHCSKNCGTGLSGF